VCIMASVESGRFSKSLEGVELIKTHCMVLWVALSDRFIPKNLSSEGPPEERSSEGTRVCKSKAQSGALSRVGGVVVPFCLGVRLVEKNKQIESAERRWQRHKEELKGGDTERENL